MSAKQLHRPGVKRQAPLAASLGGLVDQRLTGHVHHAALKQDLAAVQVDVLPAQGAQLPASGTEHDRQAQEQPELGIAFQRGRQEFGNLVD